ncbi:LPS translocon maturation chaperone LptM [Parvibaculum sp.]|uniref:LPS translocon maturation chaperone LptM n=1 Tax=Parvibaculum sp. TaxID=2024848 RepID=UPI00391D3DFF
MMMRGTKAALLGLAIIVALAACGRKGDLEAPPGAQPLPAAEALPTAEEILGDDAPIDARPISSEFDDIAPRRRVDRYN